MKASIFKPNVIPPVPRNPLKPIIGIILLYILLLSKAYAQVPKTYINATIEDTVNVSACGLPFRIDNKQPQTGETVKWEVVKGNALLWFDTSPYLDVRDMRPDTCILTYTIFKSDKTVKEIDSLVLVMDHFSTFCDIFPPFGSEEYVCGNSYTLNTFLGIDYYVSWSVSTNIEIINSSSSALQFRIISGGPFYINASASTPGGYNNLFDSYSSTATCTTATVTPANAGPDKSAALCGFPFNITGNNPASGESVIWEVVSGNALLDNNNSPIAKVLDATNGTVLRYTITNGSLTSSDELTLTIFPDQEIICNPTVSTSNPNCEATVNFNFGTTVPYIFEFDLPPGVELVGSPSRSTKLKVFEPGNYNIGITISTPGGFNTFSRSITINPICFNTVTKANAGQDISVSMCDFPVQLNGNNSKQNEFVTWEVLYGKAMLEDFNSSVTNIIDAESGTKLKYTISNGVNSTSDTLTISVNTNSSEVCGVYLSDYTPVCGDTIHASYDFDTTQYLFRWFSRSPDLYITKLSNSDPKIKVRNATIDTVNVVIYSPLYNQVYKTFVINSSCNDTVTQANAGSDKTIAPCEFPLTITGNIPASEETVKWEVVSGLASLSNINSPNVQVMDATNGAKLKYTITKGGVSSSDTVAISIEPFWTDIKCKPFVPNFSLKCNEEIDVEFPWGWSGNYWFTWSTSSGLSIVGMPYNGRATVKALSPGNHYIYVSVSSPNHYNYFSVDYPIVVQNCNTVTQANAGPDIIHPFCDFPLTLAGNTPAVGETVNWKVVSGEAVIKNPDSQFPVIVDASHNSKFVYTITNTNNGTTSSDTLNFSLHYPVTVCPPFVSDSTPSCGDTISVYFPGVDTSYHFQWHGVDLENIDVSGDTAKFKVLEEGEFSIIIGIHTPNKYSSLNRSVKIKATCPKEPITIADAGGNRWIKPCEFSYLLIGNTPKSNETVKWEVISGLAIFQQDNVPSVNLLDAINGTEIKYTISNGVESSSDTIVIFVDQNLFFGCDPYVSNFSPTCGDTIQAYFSWLNFGYTFNWQLSAGLVFEYIPFNSSYANIIVKDGGDHQVTVTVTSPYGYNVFTKTITLFSNCITVTPPIAGPDATAFCNSFQLSANQPAKGETGEWKIIEGNALIDDVNNPTANISGYTTPKVVLTWTISNGIIVKSDTVVITVNPLKVLVNPIKHATCAGNDGSALAQATGGLPPYKVQWHGAPAGNELKNVASGKYYVTVTDQSGCSVIDSAIIEDKCVGNNGYILEGTATGGGQMLTYGLAILMQDIGGLPIPVKTTHVSNGYYKFTGVAKGDYLVYILPYKDKGLTELHDLYLPTFYVNKVSIFFANPVHVLGNTYSVDIKLVEKKQWYIGTADLLANLALRSGTITPMLPVLLFNENNELVSSGFYNGHSVAFENLAPGTYYMSMSIEGEGYKNSQQVQVGTSESNVSVGLEVTGLKENHEGILKSVHAFPNPFNASIIIDLVHEFDEIVTVKFIEGVTGREIKEVHIGSPVAPFEIETSELPKGAYMLQIRAGNNVKVIPIVK